MKKNTSYVIICLNDKLIRIFSGSLEEVLKLNEKYETMTKMDFLMEYPHLAEECKFNFVISTCGPFKHSCAYNCSYST